jgi:hypothetical protein
MKGISSCVSECLFRNNVWDMGCSRLPNPPKYSLAVIRPWRVLMRPTEYDITARTITEPSPVFHCSSKTLGIVGFLGCSPNVNSSWCRKLCEGRLIGPYHAAFPVVWCPDFMVVTPSFTHLSITFSNQRFSNRSPNVYVDFWSPRRTVFVETESSTWIFLSAVTSAAVVLWFSE